MNCNGILLTFCVWRKERKKASKQAVSQASMKRSLSLVYILWLRCLNKKKHHQADVLSMLMFSKHHVVKPLSDSMKSLLNISFSLIYVHTPTALLWRILTFQKSVFTLVMWAKSRAINKCVVWIYLKGNTTIKWVE